MSARAPTTKALYHNRIVRNNFEKGLTVHLVRDFGTIFLSNFGGRTANAGWSGMLFQTSLCSPYEVFILIPIIFNNPILNKPSQYNFEA